ncbi:hypothetical protein [Borrelia duttonii]|nr:hypothetical protein [Borrelia duttonii]
MSLSFHLVKGSSMLPTILDQNWIINHKLAYGIRIKNKETYVVLWSKPKKMKQYLSRTL